MIAVKVIIWKSLFLEFTLLSSSVVSSGRVATLVFHNIIAIVKMYVHTVWYICNVVAKYHNIWIVT